MEKADNTFGLKIDNLAIINLRNEFNTYFNLFSEEDFRSKFTGRGNEIETPYLTWYGTSDSLLTLILQKSVLGIEAYIVGAVYFELGSRGNLNKKTLKYLRNPFSLKGKGTADNFYNKLPALASESYCLKSFNLELWDTTKLFYSDVRNPIFHGYEIKSESVERFPALYNFLDNLYEWIDTWYDLEKTIPGAEVLSKRKK